MMSNRAEARTTLRRPSVAALLMLAIVALVLVAVAAPAMAKPPAGTKVKMVPFEAQGTVVATSTASDVASATVTVAVLHGSHPVKDYIGKTVPFVVADSARIVKVGKKGMKKIGLDGLAAGDRVHLLGRLDRSDPTAPVLKVTYILDTGPKKTRS
jgi:hypothetical protein